MTLCNIRCVDPPRNTFMQAGDSKNPNPTSTQFAKFEMATGASSWSEPPSKCKSSNIRICNHSCLKMLRIRGRFADGTDTTGNGSADIVLAYSAKTTIKI